LPERLATPGAPNDFGGFFADTSKALVAKLEQYLLEESCVPAR
jgi:hypothetical protein